MGGKGDHLNKKMPRQWFRATEVAGKTQSRQAPQVQEKWASNWRSASDECRQPVGSERSDEYAAAGVTNLYQEHELPVGLGGLAMVLDRCGVHGQGAEEMLRELQVYEEAEVWAAAAAQAEEEDLQGLAFDEAEVEPW